MCYLKLGFLLFLPLFFFTHCSDDAHIPGSPPIADAGDDVTIPLDLAGTIALRGDDSSDPDGDLLTYQWTLNNQPEGSSASLNNANEINASVTPDREGVYEISLNVDDGNHPPVQDDVSITILEPLGSPPVANAGENQTVEINATVTLDGGDSSDPDGDSLEYEWVSNTVPVGAVVTINDADQEKATFTPAASGFYSFRLKVTDPSGKTDTDNVDVTVN
ncbi:PKD domain-containing protein [Catalinimonas niigatensis]|uniref:PKD domain-containing protein n=1 Tax=Catalinimonas niigatensis TaxID=1397264 RepID=UPI00266551DF|nr:PKD domain-containing protein [Catalinimonas niigatensis]WPP49384.1 PKD domain-containing protein [Catalinimonas niigatensis]